MSYRKNKTILLRDVLRANRNSLGGEFTPQRIASASKADFDAAMASNQRFAHKGFRADKILSVVFDNSELLKELEEAKAEGKYALQRALSLDHAGPLHRALEGPGTRASFPPPPPTEEEREEWARRDAEAASAGTAVPATPTPTPAPAPAPATAPASGGNASLEEAIKAIASQAVGAGADEEARQRIQALEEQVASMAPARRELIALPEGKEIDATGQHEQFPLLLDLLHTGIAPYLVGPAGSGKTKGCEEAAKALDLPFYYLSINAQTMTSHLLGFVNAQGDYVTTPFREAYEHGGVFLLDEMDAGNPNTIAIVNGAMEAQQAPFADGMVARHPDFKIVGAANTYGHGGNSDYMGRNPLDGATLSRFWKVEWGYDEELERSLFVGDDDRFFRIVVTARKTCREHGIKAIVSPRATRDGTKMVAKGWSLRDAVKGTITIGLDDSSVSKIEAAIAPLL